MGKPLLCGESFVNIDSMAFGERRAASGKRLLHWGSGFKAIKVQELAADRMSLASGGRPAKESFPVLVEGVWIVRRADCYYLLYSGDNCCRGLGSPAGQRTSLLLEPSLNSVT